MGDPHRKGVRKEVCRFVCNRFPSLFHRLSPSALWIHCPAALRVVPACLAALAGTVGLAVEARTQDLDSDRQALIALYNATDGEDWTNNENWLTDEPLGEWQGVTVIDGRVTGVNLVDNQLWGPIPPELGDLSSLEELDLSLNRLTGPIPPELGNLFTLGQLNLADNWLAGPIPPEIAYLRGNRSRQLAGGTDSPGDRQSLEPQVAESRRQLAGGTDSRRAGQPCHSHPPESLKQSTVCLWTSLL